MIANQVRRLYRFRIFTIFVVMALTAVVSRFVIEPEIRRTQAFVILREKNVIQPPVITMFGGRLPNCYDPIPEPFWFSVRQQMAKTFGIKTTPWYDNCRLDMDDKSLVELAKTCDDLRLIAARTQ